MKVGLIKAKDKKKNINERKEKKQTKANISNGWKTKEK